MEAPAKYDISDSEHEPTDTAVKADCSDSDKTASEGELERIDGRAIHATRSESNRKCEQTPQLRSDNIRPVCQYGPKCYRKCEQHRQQFWHPPGECSKNEPPAKKQKLCEDNEDKFFLTKVAGIPSLYNERIAIDLKDILSEITKVLMSSVQFNYMFDIPWLMRQYPKKYWGKPLLIVHGERHQAKRALEKQASQYSNVRLCQAPLADVFGTHHTKMMMLRYDEGLRIVIHTANLVEGDWHQKTQGVWISPLFPKMQSYSTSTNIAEGDSETRFKHDILLYLKAYRAKELEEWMSIIEKHDFSAARVFLIGSVPGRHTGDRKNAFGHLKLRTVLKNQGPDRAVVDSNWPVIGQFSSIGSLGPTPANWLCKEWLSSLSATKSCITPAKQLQLIFPSVDNVRNSLEGYPAGASLPYSKENAAKQPWLNAFFHQWRSEKYGRSVASPHIKTYLRLSPDQSRVSWMLITSANLSKAAWGNLEKQEYQLHIRSYELGILFLPRQWGKDSFSVNAGQEPFIPFDMPPRPYASHDQPWVWNAPHTDRPDRHGNIWKPN